MLPLLALVGLIGAGDEHPIRFEHFDIKQIVVEPVGDDAVRVTEIVDVDFARQARHGYLREIPNDGGVPIDVTSRSTANSELDVDRPLERSSSRFDTDDIDVFGTRSSSTTIRVGSPVETFKGRQRYELAYTLPDAGVSGGYLSLDVIGDDDTLSTDRVDVWITGYELVGVDCDRGRFMAEGGCDFVERDGMWFATIDDLKPGEGVTVNAQVVGRTDVVEPVLTPRVSGWTLHWPLAGILLGAGLGTLALLYLFSRWYGTNRVGAGGAAGAAFPESDEIERRVPDAELADLAATEFGPPGGMRPWQGAVAVNEAIDERSIVAWFSEMIAIGALDLRISESGTATVRRGGTDADGHPVEAVGGGSGPAVESDVTRGSRSVDPDRGVDRAAVQGRSTPETAEASSIRQGALMAETVAATTRESGSTVPPAAVAAVPARASRLDAGAGPGAGDGAGAEAGEVEVERFGEPDERDLAIIDRLFDKDAEVSLGVPSSSLATTWQAIATRQQRFARESGWWHRDVPTYHSIRPPWSPNWSVISFVLVVYALVSLLFFRSLITPLYPLSVVLSLPLVCIALTVAATGYAAFRVLAAIRPARTVTGTAATLRVLGFRKFLTGSEGRHVDAAWDRQRIREYSAWAVALDAATAWADHIELIPVPAEPSRNDWFTAMERVVDSIDFDSVASARMRQNRDRPNPWSSIARGLESMAENTGKGGGGGGRSSSSRRRSGSNRSRSSGSGSGRGGGRSGSW